VKRLHIFEIVADGSFSQTKKGLKVSGANQWWFDLLPVSSGLCELVKDYGNPSWRLFLS
jgi:hypothetical protein